LALASRNHAALISALVLGFAALPAQAAEPQPPGLNWVRLPGADACISAAALAQRVEARVGRMLFAAVGEAGLFVDGHVRPRPEQGWEVTLELSEPQGKVLGRRQMQFDGGECSVIDEAVALVIAVTLYPNTGLLESGIPLDPGTQASLQALFGQEPVDPDPGSLPDVAAAQAPSGAAQAPSGAAAKPDARADSAPRAAGSAPPTRSSGWSFGVDAAAAGGFGHLPGLNPGFAAHVAITPPSAWPIEVGAVLFPAQTEQPARASGRVRFELLAASLAVCPWQPGWLRGLAFCAGAEVGRLQVVSEGFVGGDLTANDAVASVLGSARLVARIAGVLHLRAALVLAVPLTQHRYTVETDDGSPATVFRIPQLTARAELGPALAF
jgi:hypothetical protein